MKVAFRAGGEEALRRHAGRLRRALEALHPGAVVDEDAAADVVFTPSHLLPPVEGRELVCVHDFLERQRPRLAERLALGARVVCLSQATADRIPEAEARVVPPAVDRTVFSPAPRGTGEDPFIAVVGAEGRVLDAFPALRARMRPCRVVVVGDRPSARNAPAVDFVGMLDEPDLVELYRRAQFVVIPSLYEGYGPAVLEAMACGAPVACADTTKIRELAADAARYFDPRDASSIASAMASLARNEDERAELSRRGLARAAEFPWAKAAERLWTALEEAAA